MYYYHIGDMDTSSTLQLDSMLILSCLLGISAARVIKLTPQALDKAIENEEYERLFVLITIPEERQHQNVAHHDFTAVAKKWKNVTFCDTNYDEGSKIVAEAGAERDLLPAYALSLRGMGLISHTGSSLAEVQLSRFLSFHIDSFRSSTLHRSQQTFTPAVLSEYTAARPLSSIVLGLANSAEDEREIVAAARRAGVPLHVKLGNASVARALGAPSPSVLVVHGGAPEALTAATAWPLFTPVHDHGSDYWPGLEQFLVERAHPPLVTAADDDVHRFSRSLRTARYQLTVYLVHNRRGRWKQTELDAEAARDVSARSGRAISAARTAASDIAGVARFVAIDWFEHASHELSFVPHLLRDVGKADEATLPFMVTVNGRFGESGAHRSGGNRRILSGAGVLDAVRVRAFVDAAMERAGVSAALPPDMKLWRPLGEVKEEL